MHRQNKYGQVRLRTGALSKVASSLIRIFTSAFWTANDAKFLHVDNESSDMFHISAQYIDCGHSLEPPQRGGTNAYPQSMIFFKCIPL